MPFAVSSLLLCTPQTNPMQISEKAHHSKKLSST
jgi:hypothetical protein